MSTSGFDRTRYKATPMANVKQQDADYATKRPTGGGGGLNTLKVEDGKNKFRIFPCHPEGGGSSYAEARCVSWLTVTRPKRDSDNKVIEGETELKRFPIFNAKVHGNQAKDLVEEYMGFAKDVAIPNFTSDSAVAEDVWKEITGFYSKIESQNKKNGIKPNDSKMMYASKWDGKQWGEIGQLEVGKSIQQQLTEIAIKFNSDDIQTPDPYTSPEDGIAIIIDKDATRGFKTYIVEMETVREGMTMRYVPTPLTDEQLEAFSKLTPLYKMYINSFKRSDFSMQLEGLQNFEAYLATKGYPINVLEYPDFLDVINELDSALPEEEQQEAQQDQPKPEPKATVKPTFKATPTAAPKPVVKPSFVAKQAVPEKQVVTTKTVEATPPKNDRIEAIKAKMAAKKP